MSQWKRPTDVMRTRRQKKKLSTEENQCSSGEAGAISTCIQGTHSANRKRSNPFDLGISSSLLTSDTTKENVLSKQDVSRIDDENAVASSGVDPDAKSSKLFSMLDSADKAKREKLIQQAVLIAMPPSATSARATEGGPEKDVAQFEQGEFLPLDWSLKLKLRIVAPNALFSTNTPTLSSSRALADFVHNTAEPSCGLDHVLSSLQRFCNYWVHPSLPWFPDFPRIVPDSKLRKQVPMEVGLNPDVQKALRSSWTESFISVYQQLRSGLCPYFYLCCYQLTALFCGQMVGGHIQLTACLTPSTRGLREALRRENVQFTMPNDKDGRKSSSDSDSQSVDGHHGSQSFGSENPCDDDDDAGLDITASDEGASLWLQDFGLNTKNFPTLEPSKVRVQREGYQRVDGRGKSLVFCEGTAAHSLYNFLLNFRSCTAVTGPQAGVPPTILSPAPFAGATLKNNKIMLSSARVSVGGASDDIDNRVVEICGPLLPHHVMNISAVLQEKMATTSDKCIISLNTHEHSIPFNMSLQVDPLTSENCSQIIAPSPEKRKKSSPAALLPSKRRRILGSYDSSMRKVCASDPPGKQNSSLSDVTGTSLPRTSTFGGNTENSERSKSEPCESEPVSDDNFVPGGSFSSGNKLQSGSAIVKKDPLRRSFSFGAFPRSIVKDTGLEGLPPVLIAAMSRGQGEAMSYRLKTWDNGLHKNARGQLCVSSDLKEGTALREVHCLSQGFSWSS